MTGNFLDLDLDRRIFKYDWEEINHHPTRRHLSQGSNERRVKDACMFWGLSYKSKIGNKLHAQQQGWQRPIPTAAERATSSEHTLRGGGLLTLEATLWDDTNRVFLKPAHRKHLGRNSSKYSQKLSQDSETVGHDFYSFLDQHFKVRKSTFFIYREKCLPFTEVKKCKI